MDFRYLCFRPKPIDCIWKPSNFCFFWCSSGKCIKFFLNGYSTPIDRFPDECAHRVYAHSYFSVWGKSRGRLLLSSDECRQNRSRIHKMGIRLKYSQQGRSWPAWVRPSYSIRSRLQGEYIRSHVNRSNSSQHSQKIQYSNFRIFKYINTRICCFLVYSIL